MHELGCKDMETSTNTVQIQVQIQRHEQFLKNYNKIRLIEYVMTLVQYRYDTGMTPQIKYPYI